MIIELYSFCEEIFFVDEFYVWNNHKNGGIYSWFDKTEIATLDSEGIQQISIGVEIAMSNNGRLYM